jgi:NADH-quinone oxidoreductase subunit C
MADDQKPPEPTEPPTPPLAAADKPASGAPAEPLKGEVSRTEAAPTPADPTAAQTAAASDTRPATGSPTAPADATGRPAAVAKPAVAAPKPAAPAAKPAAEHPPKAAAPTGPPDPAPPAGQTPPAFIASLQAALPGAVTHISYWVGDWTIVVAAAQIVDVARHLRDGSDAAFDMCSDVTASDWPSRAERFDVIYCLYSTRHRRRVRVKARVAEHQPIASVTPVWPGANWLEREVFDMFGVNFTGHPDRRRILMPEDWQGHPQRKDYPLEGPGELLMENPLDWLKLRQARDEADIE